MTPDEYARLDAVALAALVRSGVVQITEVLAAATAMHRHTHASINAVVEWFEDPTLPNATNQAAAALTGPLAGVPILAKDYGSAEAGRLVEMGSRMTAGNRASETAAFIARLQAAGAVIVGRSAVPEFIQHGTTESIATGPTLNPHDRTVSAGGSSGGACAAVAAGVVPVAHASDCAGSIRIPAAACGLVGLKPAPSTVPWIGGGWGGIATEFVVSRTARDSQLLLDVVADDVAPPIDRPLKIALSLDHWAGARADTAVVAATEAFAAELAGLGHHIEAVAPPVDYGVLLSTWHPLFSRWVVREALDAARQSGRPVDESMLEPVTLCLVEIVGGLTEADYANADRTRHQVTNQLAESLTGFDLLLTPALGRSTIPLGTIDGLSSSFDDYIRENDEILPYNYLFNVAGWAAASVPAGATEAGHPLGAQLAGPPGSEATILQLARALGR